MEELISFFNQMRPAEALYLLSALPSDKTEGFSSPSALMAVFAYFISKGYIIANQAGIYLTRNGEEAIKSDFHLRQYEINILEKIKQDHLIEALDEVEPTQFSKLFLEKGLLEKKGAKLIYVIHYQKKVRTTRFFELGEDLRVIRKIMRGLIQHQAIIPSELIPAIFSFPSLLGEKFKEYVKQQQANNQAQILEMMQFAGKYLEKQLILLSEMANVSQPLIFS